MIASSFAFIFPSTVGIILRVAAHRDVATTESELSQLMLQRLPVHVQNLSRAGHVSLSVLEAATDVPALKLAPVFAKIRRERHSQTVDFRIAGLDNAILGDPCGDLVRQILWRDL